MIIVVLLRRRTMLRHRIVWLLRKMGLRRRVILWLLLCIMWLRRGIVVLRLLRIVGLGRRIVMGRLLRIMGLGRRIVGMGLPMRICRLVHGGRMCIGCLRGCMRRRGMDRCLLIYLASSFVKSMTSGLIHGRRRRPTMVHGSKLSTIGSGLLQMTGLFAGGLYVAFSLSRLLLWSRPGIHSA